MTDYALQGKTRPYNVVDLHNLRSHQAYYTAISRGSSANGTLILQGFDVSKITGKISGALRQEFQELELLDDITDKYYRGKIMLLSSDYTRNSLIKAYREIKGLQYIPSSIHKEIWWSKSDPLLEDEADVKWHTTNEKQASNVVSQNTVKVNANKRKYDLIESSPKKQMSSCS